MIYIVYKMKVLSVQSRRNVKRKNIKKIKRNANIRNVITFCGLIIIVIIISILIGFVSMYLGFNLKLYNTLIVSKEKVIEFKPFIYNFKIWNKSLNYIKENEIELVLKKENISISIAYDKVPSYLNYNIVVDKQISSRDEFKGLKTIYIDLSNEINRSTITNLSLDLKEKYFDNDYVDIYEHNTKTNQITLLKSRVSIKEGNINLSVYDKNKNDEENKRNYIIVYVPLVNIELSKDYIELKNSCIDKIGVKYIPENATNKVLKYTIQEDSVEVTEDFNIIAKKVGEYLLRVGIENENVEKEIKVKILEIANSIETNVDSVTLKVGNETTINAKILPETAVNNQLEWKSSNEKVAKVDQNGKVKGIAYGNCEIEIKTKEEPIISKKISVKVELKQNTSVVNNTYSNELPSQPTYIQGILIVNKKYGLPSNYNPGVNATALSAFNSMQAAAKNEGISLFIVSGFRSYSTQLGLYNRYVRQYGQAATDTFSARAGHSEHQTGLAFDVNSVLDSFAQTKEGKWLAGNCYKYGFIIRYPENKQAITGYKYEPWHIRYLGVDIATKVYQSGLCLEEYLGI